MRRRRRQILPHPSGGTIEIVGTTGRPLIISTLATSRGHLVFRYEGTFPWRRNRIAASGVRRLIKQGVLVIRV